MTFPGDWHAGLNMAQSVFNYCYTGFLGEFQSLLGWKRINKDVSSCYFQGSWLITFVHDELVRFLGHQFVSEHINSYENAEASRDGIGCIAKEWVAMKTTEKKKKELWCRSRRRHDAVHSYILYTHGPTNIHDCTGTHKMKYLQWYTYMKLHIVCTYTGISHNYPGTVYLF